MDNFDYSPEIYTLEDENGVEQSFELLDTLEDGGNTYYAMVPCYDDPEKVLDSDAELIVLKVDLCDGEEMLVTIDDDDEYERIGNMFLERIENYYDPDETSDEPDDDYDGEES